MVHLGNGDLALIETKSDSELVLAMVEEIRKLRGWIDNAWDQLLDNQVQASEREESLKQDIEELESTIKWLESRVTELEGSK